MSPAVFWLGSVAWACAVCGGQDDADTRQAFIDTTIFLSLLPLAMMGSAGWWIWKRSQALEAPEQAPTT